MDENRESRMSEANDEGNNEKESALGQEENMQKEKKKLGKKAKVIICAAGVLVLAAIAIVVALVVKANNEAAHAEKVQNYLDDMRKGSAMVVVAAAEAEDVCITTRQVWYNTIFKESDIETNEYTIKSNAYSPTVGDYTDSQFNDDFNVSIKRLYESEYMKKKLDSIDGWNESISEMQRKLSNPPKEIEAEYDAFVKLIDAYYDLTDLAKEPTGSLQSYSEKFNECDYELMSLYNKLDRQLPES